MIPPDFLVLSRPALEHAAMRAMPLDLWVLLRLLVRADPTTHELTANPAELAEALALPSGILADILKRLRGRGLVEGALLPGAHPTPLRVTLGDGVPPRVPFEPAP